MNVTVKKPMFGLIPGIAYEGERQLGGWAVIDSEGDAMMLPEDAVYEMEQELPTASPVGVRVSVEEEETLNIIRSAGTPPPPEPNESIIDQILAGESGPPPKPVAQTAGVTPEALEKEALDLRTKEARKNLVPPAQPLLQEGQCWLTDLTEGKLPQSGVDHIITAYRWDYFPENLRADIPEFDHLHHWNPDVLENIHLAHKMNTKNLMVGDPGSGKTTSGVQYGALVMQPTMKLNGKSGIDGSTFLGFMYANANGTEFSEGLLPVAMRNGYLLIIDEVFKIPADIQMNFQTVYEENGFLLLDEKPGNYHDKLVKPHIDFRLMATDNARGVGDNFDKFGSTQVQDDSTLDRFSTTVFVPYLGQSQELRTLMRIFPAVEEEAINRFVLVANLVRESYSKGDVSIPMSMRGLKIMCRLWLEGISEDRCFYQAYTAKLHEDSEIKTVEGYAQTTVGLLTDVPVKSHAQKPKISGVEAGRKLPWE